MKLLKALAAGVQESTAFFPRLLGILRQLWNEVMGFIFFALALFFTFNANGVVQSLQALKTDPDAVPKLLLAGLFAGMFAWFGYTSFRRARKLQRSRDGG
jgi:hypothetical protein